MVTNPVWDLPTRFIHWCLPVGVGLLWWTGETGRMEWHSYVGYTLVVLVATRFVWGFVGSFHSRFRNFVRGPSVVLSYVTGDAAGSPATAGASVTSARSDSASEPERENAGSDSAKNLGSERAAASVGHNPLGAYSTLALLTVLLLQGVSGMFSIDDVAFDGPLAYYFEGNYIDVASQWHDIGWQVLQVLIALHLLAITWYQFKRGHPLVQTMWFGSRPGRESEHTPVGIGRAIVVVAVFIAVLATAINFAPEAPSYY